ncbi:MAG: hypothetical protein ACJZ49_07340 [Candidatus Thalassarchaeaceae archaeon]
MGKGETIGGALGGILGYFWGKTLVINQYMSVVANENPNLTDEVMEGVRNEFVNEYLWTGFGSAVLTHVILAICIGVIVGSLVQFAICKLKKSQNFSLFGTTEEGTVNQSELSSL